nr:MAG TPA: hypothetical protein [Caudoviricetes sp.]
MTQKKTAGASYNFIVISFTYKALSCACDLQNGKS